MDEDDLNNRLVAPETLDDPNRQYTKGEQQPTGCRDAWAAILFYAQFIAVVSVCVILGVPALNKHISTNQQGQQDESSTVDYGEFAGIAYLVGASAGCAFVLSGISLFVMTLCPKFLIQFSLLFSLAVSAVMMILGFMSGVFIGGFFGLVFFALSACYGEYCLNVMLLLLTSLTHFEIHTDPIQRGLFGNAFRSLRPILMLV